MDRHLLIIGLGKFVSVHEFPNLHAWIAQTMPCTGKPYLPSKMTCQMGLSHPIILRSLTSSLDPKPTAQEVQERYEHLRREAAALRARVDVN